MTEREGGDRNNTLSWLMFFGCGDDEVFSWADIDVDEGYERCNRR